MKQPARAEPECQIVELCQLAIAGDEILRILIWKQVGVEGGGILPVVAHIGIEGPVG